MTVLTAQTATTSTRSERPKGMRETGKLYPLRHMVRHRVPPPYQDCEVQVNLFQTVKASVTVRQATTAKRLLDGQLLLRMEARLDILNAKEAA